MLTKVQQENQTVVKQLLLKLHERTKEGKLDWELTSGIAQPSGADYKCHLEMEKDTIEVGMVNYREWIRVDISITEMLPSETTRTITKTVSDHNGEEKTDFYDEIQALYAAVVDIRKQQDDNKVIAKVVQYLGEE